MNRRPTRSSLPSPFSGLVLAFVFLLAFPSARIFMARAAILELDGWTVLQTGGSEALISTMQNFAQSAPAATELRLEFGFATDELQRPGAFADSFTVTLRNAAETATAIYLTIDAGGLTLAPASSGTVPMSAANFQITNLSPPGFAQSMRQSASYELRAPIPAEFASSSSLKIFFDLFDNQDAVVSQGFVRNVAVVPEPATAAGLAALGLFGWVMWRRCRPKWSVAGRSTPSGSRSFFDRFRRLSPAAPQVGPLRGTLFRRLAAARLVPPTGEPERPLRQGFRRRSSFGPTRQGRIVGWLILIAGFQLWAARGAELVFPLGGAQVVLEEQGAEVEVLWRAMRLNRATGQWDVEMQVRNRGSRALQSPLVVRVESFANSTGPIGADGVDSQARPFFDLSARLGATGLQPGQDSQSRTISLARSGTDAPRLTVRVFSRPAAESYALATVRALDDTGHPLGNVEIEETGPVQTRLLRTEEETGVVTLGEAAGAHRWRFGKAGYLPVWRRGALVLGQVQSLPHPRLTRRSTNAVIILTSGGQASDAYGKTKITFPSGSLAEPRPALVTALSAQALPALLPLGWSPLSAFWLEIDFVPALPARAEIVPNEGLSATESGIFVRLDTNGMAWTVMGAAAGQGTNALAFDVRQGGAYALVAADLGPTAPPAAVIGQPLPSTIVAEPPASSLRAGGVVQPAASPASLAAEEVTAQATLFVTNLAGPLPSGFLLRGTMREQYALSDETRRMPQVYDCFIPLYQRPGDARADTLQANFPMRPRFLLGPADLREAVLRLDIHSPGGFAGAVFQPAGGELTNTVVRLRSGPGGFASNEAAELRPLEIEPFISLAPPNGTIAAAFELTMGRMAQGRRLIPQFSLLGEGLSNHYVLARVIQRRDVIGLEPVERLTNDVAGDFHSIDYPPASPLPLGEGLPGLNRAGQYLLVRVAEPQSLVTGLLRDRQGQPAGGQIARIANLPWMAISDSTGRYRLISSAGAHSLLTRDPLSGDEGIAAFTATGGRVALADTETRPAGPRVTGVSPADGAIGVPRVSSITLAFSKPIQPASFGPQAVQLIDTNGAAVAGSLSLNLRGTIATLLPVGQLAPRRRYTIRVSTNILSLPQGEGLKLEGPFEFAFTTASEILDRAVAQITSHEPANGLARMVGSAGIAEPEAPVILVNETTGKTATVLSKPDGSFDNFIEAEVDDFLSAVFVNANGTRNTIPVSRQVYRDGSIGLFKAGGILEAESDGGPVRVLIEPGAIETKSKLKLQPVALFELLQLVKNTLPQNARLLGGFRFSAEGEALKSSADLSLPLNVADLNLPPGVRPEDRAFALLEPIEVDGVTVYHVVDTMQYENGKLVTHSPPYEGLGGGLLDAALFTSAMLNLSPDASLNVYGLTALVPEDRLDRLTPETIRFAMDSALRGNVLPNVLPIGGAIVSAYPGGLGATAPPGLQPGAFVARANRSGFFALKLPFNAVEHDAIAFRATSTRLPGMMATTTIGRPAYTFYTEAQLLFVQPARAAAGGISDTRPPLIIPKPVTAVLPINTQIQIPFLLRDDFSRPSMSSVQVNAARSIKLRTGQSLASLQTNIVPTISLGTPIFPSSTEAQVNVTIEVTEPAAIVLRAQAQDDSGNRTEADFTFYFGEAPPPVEDLASADPYDDRGPQVISSHPQPEATIPLGDSILLTFNEAIARSVTNGLGISLSGAAVAGLELSPDQLHLRILPTGLKSDQEYTLTLNSQVKDLRENSLDQSPSTPEIIEPYRLTFRTPKSRQADLPGIESPVESLIFGNYAYTLDRLRGTGNSLLRIHALDGLEPGRVIYSTNMPPFPRAMVLVPRYSYQRRPSLPAETNTLLVVVGGLSSSEGQWMQVFDISNPEKSFAPNQPQDAPRMLVAGGFISADPSASAIAIKWAAPRLAVAVNTTESSQIHYINLQAFILGANYLELDWAARPLVDGREEYFAGSDTNFDGDFVDLGERLPLPLKRGIFGQELHLPLPTDRYLTDFDFALGGSFLVGTMLPAGLDRQTRFQVLLARGQVVGLGDDDIGMTNFQGRRAFRVTLDLDFPARDSTGVQPMLVALVATEEHIHIVSLRDEEAPLILGAVKLPGAGRIFALTRTGSDEYTAATANGVYILRRSALSIVPSDPEVHPAVLQQFSLAMTGRTFGASDAFLVAGNGARARLAVRPPLITAIQAPSSPVTNVTALFAAGQNAILNFLARTTESPFLEPLFIKAVGPDCPAGIDPPYSPAHHYVLIRAHGDYGPELKVAVESLNQNGELFAPKGLLFPPVMLTDNASSLGLLNSQPAVQAVTARRLSTEKTNQLYNVYLSDPLVVLREPVSESEMAAITAFPGRKAIWSGHRMRFSLDANPSATADAVINDYRGQIVGSNNPEYVPRSSKTYLTLSGEYIDSPNPSIPGAAPSVKGVDLQSGEFREGATDIFLEGRQQDLVLSRTYESRSRYSGPLGRGWDFNLNMRIFELPPSLLPPTFGLCLTHYGDARLNRIGRPGDLLFIDGHGAVQLFRRIHTLNENLDKQSLYSSDPAIAEFRWTEKISEYYQSPPGEFTVLYKFRDGRFVTVSPNGKRTWFDAAGRIDRIVGQHEASQITFAYRPDGKLDRVTGDRGIYLEFNYYMWPESISSGASDLPTAVGTHRDLLARVRIRAASGIVGEVRYEYDVGGNLEYATDLSNRRTRYGYDPAPPHQLTAIGRDDGAGFPAQTISYQTGLVFSITRDGKTTTFGGAKETAEQRFNVAQGFLTVTVPSGQPASFEVDNRGRPASFANLDFKADDDGLLQESGGSLAKEKSFYNTNDTVYRFRGNLLGTARRDAPSFYTTNMYDRSAWNRLTSTTDQEGITTTYGYLGPGAAVQTMTETAGPVTRVIQFNSFGQMTSESSTESGQPAAFLRSISYGSTGLPRGEKLGDLAETVVERGEFEVTSFNRGGLNFTPGINSSGQLDSLQSSAGLNIGLSYTNGFLASQSLGNGSSSFSQSYTYDPNERYKVKSATRSETGLPSSSTTFAYESGKLQSYSGGSDTTQFTYAGVQLTGIFGPGLQRSVSYDANSKRPTNIVDQGVSATLAYDGEGRLSSYTKGGLTYIFTYNRGHQVATKTIRDSEGTVVSSEIYTYDGAGRLSTSTISGIQKRFEYFADGMKRKTFLNGVLLREVERNSAGQITALNHPGLIRYEDSNFDLTTGAAQTQNIIPTSTDPSVGSLAVPAITRTVSYDSLGRPRTVTWPCGVWTYGYDAFGNQTNLVDPDGVATGYSFSPNGLLLGTRFSDGTAIDSEYDERRRLRRIGDQRYHVGNNQTLERIDYPDGTFTQYGQPNAFFESDLAIHGDLQQQLTWPNGRLESIRAGAELLQYVYDSQGRTRALIKDSVTTQFDFDIKGLANSETHVSTLAGGTTRRWSATFNDLCHLLTETYPSGLVLNWSPRPTGQAAGAPEAGLRKIDWIGPQHLAGIAYEGGLRARYAYDPSFRKTVISYETGDINQPIVVAAFHYTLTPGGRSRREHRPHENAYDVFDRAPASQAMRITSYRFSATETNGSGAVSGVLGFRFNGNGELLSPTNQFGIDARGFFPELEWNGARLSKVDNETVTYNLQGAIRTVPVWVRLPGQTVLTRESATLAYDGYGMVRSVARGAGADRVESVYARDGLGRIVQKTVTGPAARCRPGSWQYVWKGRQLLEEYELSAGAYQLDRRYIYVGNHLAVVQAAPTPGGALASLVPLINFNGSVCGYSTPSGQLLEVILYGPYGVPVTRRVANGVIGQEMERSEIASTLLFHGAWFDEAAGLYQMGQRNLHPQIGMFLQRDSSPYVESRALLAAFNGDPVTRTDALGSESSIWNEELNGIQDFRHNFDDAREKLKAFREAYNESDYSNKGSKFTGFASASLDFVNASLKLAAPGGENIKSFVDETTAGIDALKLGVDAVQTFQKFRENRALLGAMTAQVQNAHKGLKMNFLADAGAAADIEKWGESFWGAAAYQSAKRSGPNRLLSLQNLQDQQSLLLQEERAAKFKLAHGGAKIALSLAEKAFENDEGPGAQTAKGLLIISKQLLEFSEKAGEVLESQSLSAMELTVSRAGATAALGNLLRGKSHLMAAFETGYQGAQAAIIAFSSPERSKAYARDAELFKQFGGFWGLGATVLNDLGMVKPGRWIDSNIVNNDLGEFFIDQYVLPTYQSLSKPNPTLDLYLRGIDAP